MKPRPPVRRSSYLAVYATIALILLLAHGPLLQLPFFWDEAGQFVPAALDLLRDGSLVPHSATPNIHPPGVMALVAGVWKVTGVSILAARVTMTLVAALGVLFAFLLAIELCRGAAGTPAFAALGLLCISPLFFAQTTMVLLDMPAMAASAAGLLFFLQNRFRAAAAACVVLVLTKETGIVLPAVLGGWLVWEKRYGDAVWFALPALPLAGWLWWLRHVTGHWAGNAEFAQYNLGPAFDAARILSALARRAYYLFVGSGHFIGTGVLIYALRRMPLLRDRAWRVAAVFCAAHVVAVSVTGGAVLERYLLPVLPVVYAGFAVAMQSLVLRPRRLALGALCAALVAANVVFPPYPFPFENNLAYVSFTELEMEVGAAVGLYPGTITTTFPVVQTLGMPELGFVEESRRRREIPDFRPATIEKLKADLPELMVVYSTEYDPLGLRGREPVRRLLTRLYGWQPQMDDDAVAETLGLRVARRWGRRGMRMTLLVRGGARRLRL